MTEEKVRAIAQALAALGEAPETLSARFQVVGTQVTVAGTDISFDLADVEILKDETCRTKLAQSDVPDNMLSLLTALRAGTSPIPS